jgi:hypothetical protein
VSCLITLGGNHDEVIGELDLYGDCYSGPRGYEAV